MLKGIDVLNWIDPESWQAFIEMRKRIKAPLTAYAEKLVIRELVKLKSAGHDPQACLDQSIMLGWRDVFPVRKKDLQIQQGSESASKAAEETRVWLESQRQTPEQRAASEDARRRVMSSIKRVA